MIRKLSLPLLVLALVCTDATGAWAHGGQFRLPGGGIPPGLKNPADPLPPPPPGSPPPPVTPGEDAPESPPGAPPVTPPPTGQPPTTGAPGGAPQGRSRSAAVSDTSWVWWYVYNHAEIENVKRAIYAEPATNAVIQILGGSVGSRSIATHAIRREAVTQIIPTLLHVIGARGKVDADLESAAYIALAKVTRDPRHVDLILKAIDADKPKLVTESALLAAGLLRRATARDQFDAMTLDRVRVRLFEAFDDEALDARERGFAMMGLGLLGDQPTGTGGYAGAPETTRRLFERLRARHAQASLPSAILVAISMQPAGSLTEAQREGLREGALKERLFGERVHGRVPAYCAQALGRIGGAPEARLLQRMLARNRGNTQTLQSTAIALGRLGPALTGDERIEVAKTLVRAIERNRKIGVANFAAIALARLLVTDLAAERTDVLGGSKAGDALLRLAARGRTGRRDFGALALGLVCRQIPADTARLPAIGEFRARAVAVLREGFSSRKLDQRARGAYATALGMARDSKSRAALLQVLKDTGTEAELRGYAANALALIGEPARPVTEALREALGERRGEELKIRCAKALGMLGDKQAVDLLLAELDAGGSLALKGQVVVALANVGDDRAVAPLAALVRDEGEMQLTRAQACAGLGLVGDLEWIPSLVELRTDLNYLAFDDLMHEVTSIL